MRRHTHDIGVRDAPPSSDEVERRLAQPDLAADVLDAHALVANDRVAPRARSGRGQPVRYRGDSE